MKELNLGGIRETAIERSDFPPAKLKSILDQETVAVLGYGVQGRGQSLNMRDNGVKVIVGQRKGGKAYDLCLEDGWVPGETLFDARRGRREGHRRAVPAVRRRARRICGRRSSRTSRTGRRCTSRHGFSDRLQRPDRRDPADGHRRDPRGPEGFGHDRPPTLPRRPRDQQQLRDSSGRHGPGEGARARARHRHRLGLPLRDDVPEGSVQRPDRRTRRAHGRDLRHLARPVRSAPRPRATSRARPSTRRSRKRPRACTRSSPRRGWTGCTRTAARPPSAARSTGSPPSATPRKPVFEKLYESVANGTETKRTLDANSRPDYRQNLEKELASIANSEMWVAGKWVRSLRPENQK